MTGDATGRPLSAAQVEQRRAAGMRHGARSQVSIARAAGYRKQSVLQGLGLRTRDLTPTGRYWLSQWARAAGECLLYERWLDTHGLVDETGSPPSFAATYYACRNTASRLYSKLEPHLLEAAAAKHLGGDPVTVLAAAGRAALEARGNGGGSR